jgi:hypothetical protein
MKHTFHILLTFPQIGFGIMRKKKRAVPKFPNFPYFFFIGFRGGSLLMFFQLLEISAMWMWEMSPTFRWFMLSPSSGRES